MSVVDLFVYAALQLLVSLMIAIIASEPTSGVGSVALYVVAFGSPLLIWSAVVSRTPSKGEDTAGLRVCRLSGDRPTVIQCAIRFTLFVVCTCALGLSIISILLSSNGRGIHELASGTYVSPCSRKHRTGRLGSGR